MWHERHFFSLFDLSFSLEREREERTRVLTQNIWDRVLKWKAPNRSKIMIVREFFREMMTWSYYYLTEWRANRRKEHLLRILSVITPFDFNQASISLLFQSRNTHQNYPLFSSFSQLWEKVINQPVGLIGTAHAQTSKKEIAHLQKWRIFSKFISIF